MGDRDGETVTLAADLVRESEVTLVRESPEVTDSTVGVAEVSVGEERGLVAVDPTEVRERLEDVSSVKLAMGRMAVVDVPVPEDVWAVDDPDADTTELTDGEKVPEG